MSHLTRDRLDLEAALTGISGLGLGGTAVFLGTVRSGPEDGPVQAIEYSAYDEMAEAEFDRIVGEAGSRWAGCRVLIQHRLGHVPAGETSVLVAAAAPHRAEAFEACRFVIEEVKRRVPIWKKELYADGRASWRGNDGTKGPAAVA
jgi:molybdopterin synthase catalytic subunit